MRMKKIRKKKKRAKKAKKVLVVGIREWKVAVWQKGRQQQKMMKRTVLGSPRRRTTQNSFDKWDSTMKCAC